MSENNAIKILKVKLVKGGEKLELGLKESGTVQANDTKECQNPVHPDLSKAVQALAVHLAILTDYIDQKQSGETEELEKFTVTGYSIGGKEGEEGVTITGMRRTKSGQKFAINSPFARFEASEEARYILMNDLMLKISDIEEEVKKYLYEGKMLQPSLFEKVEDDDDDEVTNLQFTNEETQQDRDDVTLQRLKGGGSQYQANPEAMERVAAGDGDSDLIKSEKDKLRGKKSSGKKEKLV